MYTTSSIAFYSIFGRLDYTFTFYSIFGHLDYTFTLSVSPCVPGLSRTLLLLVFSPQMVAVCPGGGLYRLVRGRNLICYERLKVDQWCIKSGTPLYTDSHYWPDWRVTQTKQETIEPEPSHSLLDTQNRRQSPVAMSVKVLCLTLALVRGMKRVELNEDLR